MIHLTGKETNLERTEIFRKHWEGRAKRLFKKMAQALDALDAGKTEEAIQLLEEALYG